MLIYLQGKPPELNKVSPGKDPLASSTKRCLYYAPGGKHKDYEAKRKFIKQILGTRRLPYNCSIPTFGIVIT